MKNGYMIVWGQREKKEDLAGEIFINCIKNSKIIFYIFFIFFIKLVAIRYKQRCT